MKIIDAHLHLFSNRTGWAEQAAQSVGHHNSIEHLTQVYDEIGIIHGIIMGNGKLAVERHKYPEERFHYCVGLDSSLLRSGENEIPDMIDQIREHLRRSSCCGVKLYPGYNKIALSDDLYEPIYHLAAIYDKPVAVHMGLTAHTQAHLKYCHPLALDEVAADHPRTRFVMCHFGNPFFEGAAAVLAKNPNVAADLSGLLEGRVDLDRYFEEQAGYVFLLKTWLAASNSWDRLMFGTDWPIVNLREYISFIQRIIPEKHWNKVFYQNANGIYGLYV
jgi:predicted TIM-barrel fold metal-dependent hydrolase